MPIELGIWKLGKKLEKISFSTIDSEHKVEATLAQDIAILPPGLMLLGRQIATAHGKFIDLLAMDADGNLSIIELKKNRTPREAVAQLLDYASWVQSLSYDDISAIYAYPGNSGTPTNLNSQKWHEIITLFEFNFMGVPDLLDLLKWFINKSLPLLPH
jgi:RecB family endonuclease NucS